MNLLPAQFLATLSTAPTNLTLPRSLETYADPAGASLRDVLVHRIAVEPFNLVATAIFFLAIVHTFLTARFRHWAHEMEAAHATRRQASASVDEDGDGVADEVSFKGQVFHFLGEVEAVFGIWAAVLAAAITFRFGWSTVLEYIGRHVNYTEPMFVVVIMALASTRPILRFAEACLRVIAGLGGGGVGAWWLTILIVAPILGSFITEPAAMTIGALLLAQQFYVLKPSRNFAYATIGLLFVNVSVGGTLTHFAAPPVLMVAARWNWNTAFMFFHFGWKAAVGIAISSTLYYLIYRRELTRLNQTATDAIVKTSGAPVPAWITGIQVAFVGFTVLVAHYPPLFIGGFLFFLAFSQATAHHQGRLELRSPLLVGFFLAGLVIHGGLQSWWIEPVLKRLGEVPLFLGATVLTAFNDNAAITYLASLVPGFTDALKYAVVAGAVTGGGLTVIANAPNPAGQSLLSRFFPDGVSPLPLALAALPATAIMAACFLLL
jgi:hypothetical protein